MTVLASHQPDFAPYPGFFYKMLKSDIFVISDDVAYSNSEMHKYNYIFSPEGRHRFGLPVQAHADGKPIKDVMIARDERLIGKLLKTFEQTYKKHPYFPDYGQQFMELLEDVCQIPFHLALQNYTVIEWFADRFGYKGDIIWASDLKPKGRRDDRILDICKKLGADVYISGIGAAAYHEPERFADAGVELVYTDYKTLEYSQYGNKGKFLADLSMIDYVMNCGFEIPFEWR